jgi:hypothetical protein
MTRAVVGAYVGSLMFLISAAIGTLIWRETSDMFGVVVFIVLGVTLGTLFGVAIGWG